MYGVIPAAILTTGIGWLVYSVATTLMHALH
ncbi:hypothetical protein SAMN00768000_3616 [Sulfobacillus thermosulfidooxidans DSM 9293]|uniref:Uncharacterized protein n=1 Tax=Sulfobacillus thermosulfidooxidans (strain DSM 9293 / VKM B-1269 / AT-1) TaxID=929705 RepID=A0A1W1WP05_SULTA|nr:hypothetical protein SAMN00768000_3616 [Sulfobacillus thermosulfidooxidans DSM 9293]